MRERDAPERRRGRMRDVPSRNTRPELAVRRLLFALGYRFRVHADDLPGKPDIVFRARRKLVFVNGCLWHGHGCPLGDRLPVRNRRYWTDKIAGNAARDIRQRIDLKADAWDVLTVWECELDDVAALAAKLRRFLGHPSLRGADAD